MTRLPDRYSLMLDYVIAQGCREGDLYISSFYVDEQKISCTMRALDLVIDRCENIVHYTGRTLLCWLLSPKLHIYRETPFYLVAEKSSETQYKSHDVWNMFDVSRGLWPDLGNYLSVEETSMALNEDPSSSAENEDEERTGDNDEDDLNLEEKDNNNSDGNWDSEDDELDHDNSLLYEVYLTLCTETFITRQPGSMLLVYFSGILVTQLEEMLTGGVYMEGGSCPQVHKLFALKCENGLFTSCGIYVWGGSVFYIICFLPARLSRAMYLYLVYIRRLASLLHREQVGYSEVTQKGLEERNKRLLFHINRKAWPTSRLTEILVKATLKIWN
ncbi:hypothetical protein DER46DRAFT_624680 [Fusarium sp. MPI-SDFR-AT-0072]|nr:hypothetical protein DER46DRAFT_624680 [Fusarium sp. MPI-SDFR-AT-0072]